MQDQALSVDDTPVRKQQQRSIVTQHKLLDAATEAFSENGFKGTSTREIADRAGVHHPLITYHFKNKDQLWRAATDRIFRNFNISLVKAVSSVSEANPRKRAETFIRTYVQYSHSRPALHKIILQESSYPSDRLDWLVDQHLQPIYNRVVGYIEQLQESGAIPAGNPALMFNMIRVCAGGLLALSLEIKATSGVDFDQDGALEELSNVIIRCFLPNTSP